VRGDGYQPHPRSHESRRLGADRRSYAMKVGLLIQYSSYKNRSQHDKTGNNTGERYRPKKASRSGKILMTGIG